MSFDKITHGTPIIPVPGNPSLAVDITNDVLYIGNPLTGTWVSASPSSGNSVTSLNSEKGAVVLVAGSGISVTPAGQNITIAATGGGTATAVNLPTSTSDTVGTIAQNSTSLLSTFGSSNLFLGNTAGNFTMTGADNTGVGLGALNLITTGTNNTAISEGTLGSLTTGSSNAGIGNFSLQSVTSGGSNTGVGVDSLGSVTTGGSNIGIGQDTGERLTTGSNNILIGTTAAQNLTTGSNNIAIGPSVGAVTTGSANIEIGFPAPVASPTASNQLNIGNTIYATGLNGPNTGHVGINKNNPATALDILGGITFSGALNPLVAIVANGAIPANISANYVTTVAVALTIAAPASDNLNIFVTTFDTATPTITFTGGTLNSGSAAVTTASFAAFAGSSLHLVSHTGKWNVLGSNAITFA